MYGGCLVRSLTREEVSSSNHVVVQGKCAYCSGRRGGRGAESKRALAGGGGGGVVGGEGGCAAAAQRINACVAAYTSITVSE